MDIFARFNGASPFPRRRNLYFGKLRGC